MPPSDIPAQPSPTDVVRVPVEPVAATPDPEPRFTAEDIARVRAEEKDKLYTRMTKQEEAQKALQDELAALRGEREAKAKAEADALAAAEAADKAKAEAEMSAKKLLEQRTSEWETRFAALEAERATERELFLKEQEFARVREYTNQRLAAERDNIAPELLDLVGGNTNAEVDASIDMLKAKSAAIVESIQAAQTAARSQMRGVSPNASALGPLDDSTGYRELSANDIKGMSMAEYAKYRSHLIGSAGSNRGLYG
jgi:chromosome segregation ATPase